MRKIIFITLLFISTIAKAQFPPLLNFPGDTSYYGNGIITGQKLWIWADAMNGHPSSAEFMFSTVKFDNRIILPGTTLQYVRGDGSLATFPTMSSGTVTSIG